jgi:hypothetical protein
MRNLTIAFFLILTASWMVPPNGSGIDKGQQPQITVDDAGTVRILYGFEDKIYCATSSDQGLTFPDIALVGEVENMHLGMTRGPQIATSKHYSLVTAIDKKGNVHTFQLNHQSGKWVKKAVANDVPGAAIEGLMDIGADDNDHFYAVWLDHRNGTGNEICFTYTLNQGETWSKNKIVYKSPDHTVCECCQPSIAAGQSGIFIMFRNWINGSRDLYLIRSTDEGHTFGTACKLGYGTWKLNACPMDGGGLAVRKSSGIYSVWQREGKLYLVESDKKEEFIAQGRSCDITDGESPIITWQEGSELKLLDYRKGKSYDLGEGGYIKAARLKDNSILTTWEKDGNIFVKKL